MRLGISRTGMFTLAFRWDGGSSEVVRVVSGANTCVIRWTFTPTGEALKRAVQHSGFSGSSRSVEVSCIAMVRHRVVTLSSCM